MCDDPYIYFPYEEDDPDLSGYVPTVGSIVVVAIVAATFSMLAIVALTISSLSPHERGTVEVLGWPLVALMLFFASWYSGRLVFRRGKRKHIENLLTDETLEATVNEWSRASDN